ncbi:SGNH/GDSL hydrolase family protein [Streptomyces sp. NPDC051940]|uniref:SGNH/GDSL hydrolase family protein n=1 Tax=Streptomyces sp. NPDC051940 TaxID=3155675 RepID=UPI00341FAB04
MAEQGRTTTCGSSGIDRQGWKKPRRSAVAALAASGAAALVVAGTAAPAGATPAEHYVALGDSYTSGPRIPTVVNGDCERSDHNYPSLTAAALGVATFKDASCGGARTVHMWEQQGSNPPQLDALDKTTTLVSLGISGNDIGFGEIIGTCTALSFTDPTGNPCERRYTATGTDELAARIADASAKVDKVIDAIHDRAPRARVVVVGYPVIVPDDGVGCRPAVMMADKDIPYLRDTEKRLNDMLRTVAAGNRAQYADSYAATVGHDICKSPADRWVEPLVPANPAAPFHPNAKGEQAMADAVLGLLAAPGRGR